MSKLDQEIKAVLRPIKAKFFMPLLSAVDSNDETIYVVDTAGLDSEEYGLNIDYNDTRYKDVSCINYSGIIYDLYGFAYSNNYQSNLSLSSNNISRFKLAAYNPAYRFIVPLIKGCRKLREQVIYDAASIIFHSDNDLSCNMLDDPDGEYNISGLLELAPEFDCEVRFVNLNRVVLVFRQVTISEDFTYDYAVTISGNRIKVAAMSDYPNLLPVYDNTHWCHPHVGCYANNACLGSYAGQRVLGHFINQEFVEMLPYLYSFLHTYTSGAAYLRINQMKKLKSE